MLYRKNGTISKERQRKAYRHPALDDRLRKERTDQEARLLEKAYQAGVRVPTVQEQLEYTVEMEEIGGEPVKNVLEDDLDMCETIGDSIARLHNKNVIHGDLTTSNMIRSGDEVYFIDFGLGFFSQRIEDRAIDLHLLKEVLESTHTAVADEAMERILAAYKAQSEDAEQVLQRYEEIEERGRYK